MSIDRIAAKIAAVPLNARGHRRYPATLKREIMTVLPRSGMTRCKSRRAECETLEVGKAHDHSCLEKAVGIFQENCRRSRGKDEMAVA